MSFSSRLKERREFLGMSRNDMAEKLNITPSAIGNYENAISSPKEEILYKIFEVLDVEPNYLWQDEIKKNITDFSCSYPEQNMIKKYRALDEHGIKIVDSVLNEEYSRCEEIAKQNQIAVQSVRNHVKEELLQVSLFDLPASAGTGVPLESEYKTLIEVPKNELTLSTDYIVRVSGDSMEPDFYDGDLVLVEANDAEINEIGIFVADGEGYIKKRGTDSLISLNDAYKPLPYKNFGRIDCKGKVIGKL